MSSPSPQSKAATTSSSNIANTVSASSSCPQSIVKSLSPLSLDEFEIVSSAASDIVDKLPNCHDNDRLIRRKSDGKLLVWKRIHYGSMDEQELKMLLSELMVVRQIRHPNIVEYVGRIVDEVKQDVYIVSEYCANGDLTGVIKKHIREGKYIPEQQIWKWLTQLSLALRCCHCRQGVKAVLHRDLKPANCFLDSDGNLKLGDFGLARVLRHSGSFASTFVGTPYYMSPEQMQKSAYTEKSDIWSLGIVAYELACLRPPFVADKQRDLATRIRRGEFEPPPDWYSPALRTLISDCLSVNPDHRPTVEDLLRRPEMRNRLSANESTPEASLRHWSDQLRELTDLLTAWQDSLTRQEVELRRQEASLASAAAARQMELEKREARLDRLAKQLDERTKQLTELQDWLRHSGFTTSAAGAATSATSVTTGTDSFGNNAMLLLSSHDSPLNDKTLISQSNRVLVDIDNSPQAVVSTTTTSAIERGRNSSTLSNNPTISSFVVVDDKNEEFENTLPVPSISTDAILSPCTAAVATEDLLVPRIPVRSPPVPLPRKSRMQQLQQRAADC
ncbi:hypothetical protein BOX15_Mlig003906g2 [Macrostomum lignano]|uniref:non-specific serine/threonine protein kinase n=1 Tax=Macrostomum lignano TaxID=282301 RepID=A0A267FZQ3_9PLAT|nr:hypothetical protein BOX15_Mlig003906g2 [Macrostomum lignano]